MTVFKKEQQKNNLKLCIVNELIKRDDIKDLKTLKLVLEALKGLDLSNLYYYELYEESEPLYSFVNYFSGFEFDLVDILNVSLPIGYSIDIIYSIMLDSHKYSSTALNNLSSIALLELYSIGLFNKDLSHLFELLNSYGYLSDMGFKYVELSLNSFISEKDKIEFLLDLINDMDVE